MGGSRKLVPCVSNKVFHILNCAFLVLVLIFQSFVLNSYIIAHTGRADYASYFWFLGDIFLAGLFVAMAVKSYNYLTEQKLKKKEEKSFSFQTPESNGNGFLGYLPLCYVAWLCYSSVLVTKMAYIFKSELVNMLNPQAMFGPQLLKFTLALSTVIFILLVAAHHDAERESQRGLAVRSMCTNTAFELLDSLAFLSLLIISESKLIVPFDFENVVLSFACVNFFLPTIALYQFSLSDFGQVEQPLDLKGVYHLCHLALVNIPYLGVRIYLWSGYGSDISLFIMKNVIGILFHLKDVVPDFVLLNKQCLAMRRTRQPAVRANSTAREDALELQ